jgi:hypothetical protein
VWRAPSLDGALLDMAEHRAVIAPDDRCGVSEGDPLLASISACNFSARSWRRIWSTASEEIHQLRPMRSAPSGLARLRTVLLEIPVVTVASAVVT